MAYFRQLIDMTTCKIVLTSNYVKDGKQTFPIKGHSVGEHAVKYLRDTAAKESEDGSARRVKLRTPSVLDVRSAIVRAAAATTKTEAIAAVMAAEPEANRATIRHYVGDHAAEWGLS